MKKVMRGIVVFFLIMMTARFVRADSSESSNLFSVPIGWMNIARQWCGFEEIRDASGVRMGMDMPRLRLANDFNFSIARMRMIQNAVQNFATDTSPGEYEIRFVPIPFIILVPGMSAPDPGAPHEKDQGMITISNGGRHKALTSPHREFKMPFLIPPSALAPVPPLPAHVQGFPRVSLGQTDPVFDRDGKGVSLPGVIVSF